MIYFIQYCSLPNPYSIPSLKVKYYFHYPSNIFLLLEALQSKHMIIFVLLLTNALFVNYASSSN